MFSTQGDELIQIEDVLENDEYVLIKALYIAEKQSYIEVSVGIKDQNGDIVKVVSVDKYKNQ